MPTGEIVSISSRGDFMGNRGGRIHDVVSQRLHPTRRWSSKQWICCKTDFNQRQRQVMGNSYTELFFLDEPTALSAGHRPCFECRRQDFLDFAECWRKAKRHRKRPTAAQMDHELHENRLVDRQKLIKRVFWNDLPNGAIIAHGGGAIAKYKELPIKWGTSGYESILDVSLVQDQLVSCLTPEITLCVLKSGYKPIWHDSINQLQY